MTSAQLITADVIVTGIAADGVAQIIDDGAILVSDGKIAKTGTAADLRRAHPDVPQIGGKGRVAMPGLINAHHHVGLTPFQMGARDQPLELWFGERLVMRDVDPRLDTLFSAFEMIASGVTTVQHLHSRAPGSQQDVINRADAILSAYAEIGMRVSYSFALRDQNRMIYDADDTFIAMLPPEARSPMKAYLDSFALPLADQIGVFHALRAAWADHPLTAIQIAPANLHWLSDHALEQAALLAQQTGAPMHMHLLETPYQKEYAHRRTGGSAMEFINRLGLLGPQMTIGHGTWMTPDDIALLAEKGACLCHNCSSNLRLKSGTLDLNAVLGAGITCGLGMDEAGINDDRDMLQEMRLALTLHRPAGHDSPAPKATDIFRMATIDGAATTPFAGKVGQLAPGLAADIVLMDWTKVCGPWQDPAQSVVDVILRRARPSAIETVLIGGQIAYHEGAYPGVDKAAIYEAITRALRSPDHAGAATRRQMKDAALPAIKAYYASWPKDF
jgi:5-methylthioadenosine/S-adenosylhomocysteine deaminase